MARPVSTAHCGFATMEETPMKKILGAASVLLAFSTSVFAQPAIDFTSLGPTSSAMSSFNAGANDSATVGGIVIHGFTYGGGTTFNTNQGYLWLRNDSEDRGLGYCSEGSNCGATNTTGRGDWNELSNNYRDEVIRLTRPNGQSWSDLWVSSLDAGGSNSNETGTIYWSNIANPNLDSLTTSVTFSHNLIDPPGGGEVVEASIWSQASGLDVNATYLFFRAGPSNGTNNDYLVYGAGITPAIPEPETYALLLVGLGLLGFEAFRRKNLAQRAAA